MKPVHRLIVFIFILIDVFLLGKILLAGKNVQILNPQGYIALQDRDLLFVAVSLMLVVVVPVFFLAYHVATTYHADNKNAHYAPDWDHSNRLQLVIWGVPTVIICILSCMVWIYGHKLDPHVALSSTTKPITIQVVALRWKWLFIYPEQGIATENYVVFPEKTPIHFELTGYEAPMNSFWIPQLGGQIYAMSGMATQTHLIADSVGEYQGSTAEISGAGFADMQFKAKSVTSSDFTAWVTSVKQEPSSLTMHTVSELSKPSEDRSIVSFSSTEDNLYNTIVMQYMAPPRTSAEQMNADQKSQMQEMEKMPGS
jgi:cytochrome o ubiquinol oxidase subunit 2